jgi:hypothetical protein
MSNNSFATLTMMCRFPSMLIDDELSHPLAELLKRYLIRTRTWDHLTPPHVDVNSRTITIGWPFVRQLWAKLFGYVAVFEWWESVGSPNSIHGFVSDQKNDPIIRLFNWALDQTVSRNILDFPDDVPKPPPDSAPFAGTLRDLEMLQSQELLATLEGRVSRTFQRAICWMILHEAGHILFGHSGIAAARERQLDPMHTNVRSVMQEKQADDQASVWLLKETPNLSRYNVFGVVGTHVTMCSGVLTVEGRAELPDTHFPPLVRLRQLLQEYLAQDRVGWAAASLFLELELWAQGLPSADHKPFGSLDHLLQVFINAGGRVIQK